MNSIPVLTIMEDLAVLAIGLAKAYAYDTSSVLVPERCSAFAGGLG